MKQTLCVTFCDRLKKIKIYARFIVLSIPFWVSASDVSSQNLPTETKANQVVEIRLSDYITKNRSIDSIIFSGNPSLIETPFGQVVCFDGIDDGIWANTNPLEGLNSFTIEILLRIDEGGNFEQRYLHIGEVNGPRVLMELRATEKDWYLDTFLSTEKGKLTLINKELSHPLNQWYHIAFVVDNGVLTNYVNGVKEMEEALEMSPLNSGQMSIGVRQDKRSWFKGAIYKIRISPGVLDENEFMSLE
jgi:hypothetical protein